LPEIATDKEISYVRLEISKEVQDLLNCSIYKIKLLIQQNMTALNEENSIINQTLNKLPAGNAKDYQGGKQIKYQNKILP